MLQCAPQQYHIYIYIIVILTTGWKLSFPPLLTSPSSGLPSHTEVLLHWFFFSVFFSFIFWVRICLKRSFFSGLMFQFLLMNFSIGQIRVGCFVNWGFGWFIVKFLGSMMTGGGTYEVPWWIILLVSLVNVELPNLFMLGAGLCMRLGLGICYFIKMHMINSEIME